MIGLFDFNAKWIKIFEVLVGNLHMYVLLIDVFFSKYTKCTYLLYILFNLNCTHIIRRRCTEEKW